MILFEDEECAGCLNIGKAACNPCCVPNGRLQCGAGLSFATVYFLQDALRVRIALFASLFQPDFGLTVVLLRAAPLEIHHAQAVLGGRETLFRRFAVPIQCLPSVLRHAFTFIVPRNIVRWRALVAPICDTSRRLGGNPVPRPFLRCA